MAIIDGKSIAQKLRGELEQQVTALKKKNIIPGLAVILVGENPASQSYVRGKEQACAKIGIYSRNITLPVSTSQDELLNIINELNQDQSIDGILVQLPLPPQIDEQAVIETINPSKDVDGFHPVSIGRMMLGEDTFLPCTPHGIIKLLEVTGIETSGKEVVVLGRSNIVGKPVANMLLQKSKNANATVTVCHTGSLHTKEHTRRADIIIAAAGRPDTLTEDMVKKGAVVIDVGVNRVEDSSKERGYRLVGDADFNGLSAKCSYITPVPGGVGPMTITMLLHNTVKSAGNRAKQ